MIVSKDGKIEVGGDMNELLTDIISAFVTIDAGMSEEGDESSFFWAYMLDILLTKELPRSTELDLPGFQKRFNEGLLLVLTDIAKEGR